MPEIAFVACEEVGGQRDLLGVAGDENERATAQSANHGVVDHRHRVRCPRVALGSK